MWPLLGEFASYGKGPAVELSTRVMGRRTGSKAGVHSCTLTGVLDQVPPNTAGQCPPGLHLPASGVLLSPQQRVMSLSGKARDAEPCWVRSPTSKGRRLWWPPGQADSSTAHCAQKVLAEEPSEESHFPPFRHRPGAARQVPLTNMAPAPLKFGVCRGSNGSAPHKHGPTPPATPSAGPVGSRARGGESGL